MTEEVRTAATDAALERVIATMPDQIRESLPRNGYGEPRVEVVRALYRHDPREPGHFEWVEVRQMAPDEWASISDALSAVYRLTRGLDTFPSFAWGELRAAQDEFLKQLRERTTPNEWMGPLIEYRVINFSTAVKLYYEQVMAHAHQTSDQMLPEQIRRIFSEVYDGSFAYRLIYSIRNAFQHGDRGLITLRGSARLGGPSGKEVLSDGVAVLDKAAFASGKSNGAVRREVRELDDGFDLDLFELSSQCFAEIEKLSERITPLLHPAAPQAAQTIARYFDELGGVTPHFHEYIKGFPSEGILGMPALDRLSFAYVVEQVNRKAVYAEGPAAGVFAILPTYPEI